MRGIIERKISNARSTSLAAMIGVIILAIGIIITFAVAFPLIGKRVDRSLDKSNKALDKVKTLSEEVDILNDEVELNSECCETNGIAIDAVESNVVILQNEINNVGYRYGTLDAGDFTPGTNVDSISAGEDGTFVVSGPGVSGGGTTDVLQIQAPGSLTTDGGGGATDTLIFNVDPEDFSFIQGGPLNSWDGLIFNYMISLRDSPTIHTTRIGSGFVGANESFPVTMESMDNTGANTFNFVLIATACVNY